MSSRFRIDCQWVEPAVSGSADRHLLAEVGIEANGVPVTALSEAATRTFRSGIRVSAYDLAAWFVANWWRLRWETHAEGVSWNMSHRIGAVGNGYLWPDVEFVGGDATVQVRAKPISLGSTAPVRFLNAVDVHVPATDFEFAVRQFVETVIMRLESWSGQAEEELQELATAWSDLRQEIEDSKSSFDRAIEARMGFDPEEAQPALLDCLRQAAHEVGRSPIEELAASSKGQALEDFETLWRDVRQRSRSMQLEVGPGIEDAAARIKNRDLKPSKKGAALAQIARRDWSISDGAVDSRDLAELCGVSGKWIDTYSDEDTPIPVGFRGRGDEGVLKASLKKRHPTARRFALARIIGDHLLAGANERLLPVTDGATDRQKFQRAFGQAFLCPIAALRDYLGSKVPDDDFIEDAARYFNVSSWLVTSALINHGMLSPATLAS